MRLLINTSMLRFGGAVQVALSVIYECRHYPQHEFHVVVGPGVGAVLKESDFPANFRFHRQDYGVMNLGKRGQVQRTMAAIEADVRPDCVLTTSGPAYWRSKAPHLMGFNLPLYIYPESPYLQRLSLTSMVRLRARRWLHVHHFRREADALFVQTDDVNQRVRRLMRTERVHTITNNHNGWYDEPRPCVPRLPPHTRHVSPADTVQLLRAQELGSDSRGHPGIA